MIPKLLAGTAVTVAATLLFRRTSPRLTLLDLASLESLGLDIYDEGVDWLYHLYDSWTQATNIIFDS